MKKFIYYLLSFTWGGIMTLVGLLVALVLVVFGKNKPKKFEGCLHFMVGKKSWGGLSLGIVILTDKGDHRSTKSHEVGHSLQNCLYGVLMPIFSLCSAARYHYRNYRTSKGYINTTAYDDFWFEGQATRWGKKHIERAHR